MIFDLVIFHSDLSAGTSFIRSLNHARQCGWGADIRITGVATHPLRSLLSQPDETLLRQHDSQDCASTLHWLEQRMDRPPSLVYEPKSAEYMFSLAAMRHLVPTFLPPTPMLHVLEDKFQTYLHLRSKGYSVPETYLLTSPDDIVAAFERLATDSVWVRDTVGQGGRGSYVAKSASEVLRRVQTANAWGRCTISTRLPTDREHPWLARLSSDLLPGEMISWSALYVRGSLVASQTRKRLYWEHSSLTESGVTGYSGANMTINRRDVHDLSDRIVRSWDWAPHGPLGIDYVVDNTGALAVTEIQASRFFASTYAMTLLGLNFPRLFVDVFRGVEVPMNIVDPCDDGFIYIQRFGSDARLVHRDDAFSMLSAVR